MGTNPASDLKLQKEEPDHVFSFTLFEQKDLKQVELSFFLRLFPFTLFLLKQIFILLEGDYWSESNSPFFFLATSYPILNSTCLLLGLQDSSTSNQSCEELCCNFVLFTFLTYFTMGFWGAFFLAQAVKKKYIKVLASWAYINVVN